VILDAVTFEAVDLVDISWNIMLLLSLDDKGCTFDCDSTGTGDACVGFGAVCIDVDVDLDASVDGACLDANGDVIVNNISAFLWTEATNSLKIVPTGIASLSVEFEGGFKGLASDEVEFSVDGRPVFLEPINVTTSFFAGSYDLAAAETCMIDFTSFDALVDGLDQFDNLDANWRFVADTPPTDATCSLVGEFPNIDVQFVADGALELLDTTTGALVCSVPGQTTIDTATRFEQNLEKTLIEGPLEIGICLPEPTLYRFVITYSGPEAVVSDVVPAELDNVLCTASAGTLVVEKPGGPKSSTRITWTVPAGEELTLDCTLQTGGSPGGCKGGNGHRPTSCGPLALNEGATATGTEIDPKTGVEQPFTLTTEPLVVEAVAGAQPCR
jgi:hypothetical protein